MTHSFFLFCDEPFTTKFYFPAPSVAQFNPFDHWQISFIGLSLSVDHWHNQLYLTDQNNIKLYSSTSCSPFCSYGIHHPLPSKYSPSLKNKSSPCVPYQSFTLARRIFTFVAFCNILTKKIINGADLRSASDLGGRPLIPSRDFLAAVFLVLNLPSDH